MSGVVGAGVSATVDVVAADERVDYWTGNIKVIAAASRITTL